MEFITNNLFVQKGPKSTMAANHATNYNYKNCSFCTINYIETSSTAIDIQKYKIAHPYVGICG